MTAHTTIGDKQAGVFKTYPEFSKLTLADREKYEAFISDYPPIDNISFPTLISWWNSLDACCVAELNGNLVVSYWIPGLDQFSGLGLIGTNMIDETICTIFDSQKAKNNAPKLLHIPEFVVNHIEHPDLFKFTAMPEFDEYIMPVSTAFPLSNQPAFKQRRVRKFLEHTKGLKAVVRSVDMSRDEGRQQLLSCVTEWPREGKGNNFSSLSDDNMRYVIENYDSVKSQNICLFVDGELQSCLIFYKPKDKRYVVVGQFRVNSDFPYTFDYAVYAFSEWFATQGYSFVNNSFDVGLPRLRALKLSLGPATFFRKYIIEPAA